MSHRTTIAIDGNHMLGEHVVGMGQYARGLLQAMAKADPGSEYLVFALGRSTRLGTPPVLAPNVSYRVRPVSGRVHERLLLAGLSPPMELLVGRRPDICIWPNFVSWPTLPGVGNVVVIHDLGFLLHSQFMTSHDRDYYSILVPRALRRADRVIAVSSNCKRELCEHLAVPAERIAVVPPAIEPGRFHPRSEEEIERVTQAHGVRGPYILYTGTVEPRKNLVSLLNAYAALPQALRDAFTLVLAGGQGWLDGDIRRRLDELSTMRIITTGYVSDADLPALYSGARLFVYPSLYEGFGMPPLEAMACGVPVITSNNSSLPEVVGDAGVMVSATDIDELSSAIERVLTDEDLAAAMRTRGLLRAAHLTWAHSASLMGDVLAELGRRTG
jgi:glycosyltransferase involved in cell wall biosynthesis